MLVYLLMLDNDEDKNKFEILYNEYRNVMYHVANSVLKYDFLAEDAVHEAFMKIAENIEKVGKAICPQTKAFVIIICKNTAINMYNKRKRENSVPIEEFTSFSSDEVVDEKYFEKADERFLMDEIRKLPEIIRDSIYLCEVCGYSQKETAKMLGVKYEAVKKRIQRGKQILKSRLMEVYNEQ